MPGSFCAHQSTGSSAGQRNGDGQGSEQPASFGEACYPLRVPQLIIIISPTDLR